MIRGRLTAGRIEVDHGLDLTRAESLTGLTSMNVIKFASGCYIGSNYTTGEWSKGIKIKDTLTEGTYTTEYKGKYASVVTIEANTTSTRDGHTNGAALRVEFAREAGYNHTGGSEDIAARINATNYCTLTSGGIRALNIISTNRTGTVAKVQGMLVTAHQRNSGGFTTGLYGARIVSKNQSPSVATGYQHALEVADESDGVQPALNSIVWIEKQSNSYTAATRAGVEIVNNCNTTYAQVITHGVYFKSGATNSNITYAFGFDSADYTDGAYDKGSTVTCANLYGAIKVWVYDQAFYIPLYETAS
jgi:hypothetical protein